MAVGGKKNCWQKGNEQKTAAFKGFLFDPWPYWDQKVTPTNYGFCGFLAHMIEVQHFLVCLSPDCFGLLMFTMLLLAVRHACFWPVPSFSSYCSFLKILVSSSSEQKQQIKIPFKQQITYCTNPTTPNIPSNPQPLPDRPTNQLPSETYNNKKSSNQTTKPNQTNQPAKQVPPGLSSKSFHGLPSGQKIKTTTPSTAFTESDLSEQKRQQRGLETPWTAIEKRKI